MKGKRGRWHIWAPCKDRPTREEQDIILVGWKSESCVSNRIQDVVNNGIFFSIFWHCLSDWDFRTRERERESKVENSRYWSKKLISIIGILGINWPFSNPCPWPKTIAFLADLSIFTSSRKYPTISPGLYLSWISHHPTLWRRNAHFPSQWNFSLNTKMEMCCKRLVFRRCR